MQSFINPFQEHVEQKLTNVELIQAIRLDIAGELETIYTYDAHIHATDDVMAQKVIIDIRDEEKVHVGELMTLLRNLDSNESELFASGETEANKILEKFPISQPSEWDSVAGWVKRQLDFYSANALNS